MLITQTIRTTVLTQQLNKIKQLHQISLVNKSFWLGYLAAYSSRPLQTNQWIKLVKNINQVLDISNDGLFSEINTAQLFLSAIDNAVCKQSRQKWLKNPGIQPKNTINFISENIDQLSIDNNCLKNKYFVSNNQQEMIPQNINKINSDIGLQCSICCQKITHSTVCPIACGHLLHKNCFQQYTKSRVQSKMFPIICPMQECAKQIPTTDIEQYIQGQTLKKYFQFSLHEFVDKNRQTSWCPTAGCQAIFQYDQELTQYACPSCKKQYCLKCKSPSHHGFSCQKNQQMQNLPPQEKKFIQYVKGSNYKKCPNCQFWVSKNRGCDHMTCRCGFQFCYRCGANYGQCDCEQNESFYDSHGSDDDDENQDI